MKSTLQTILISLAYLSSYAQAGYQPSPENLQARKWFTDAKFGMFIHWGVFSLPGRGEWVMNNENIKVDDYTKLKDQFNPIKFDAKEWVSLAKKAGMKYITLITRHHDGFSMWATKASDFNIMNTPYHKDIVKQMADECHRQNIKLFVYYSLLDWRRNDYSYWTGHTGQGTGRTKQEDWNSYIAFMKAQLTELLTNYGPIAGVWFDGNWDQVDKGKTASNVNWHYDEIYSLIHRLQPAALISNNHHQAILPGEDFQAFEKDLPGGNTAGFNEKSTISSLPLETCETINNSWGYDERDHKYKSLKDLIGLMVRASGNGANLLLNIGPKPKGDIQPEFVERLDSMGKWLHTYGPTIYGTLGGNPRPQSWGAITKAGSKVYIHLLNFSGETFSIPDLPYQVISANLFNSKKKLNFKQQGTNFTVDVKSVTIDPLDTVIELNIRP